LEVYDSASYELLDEAKTRSGIHLDEEVEVYVAGILARLFGGDIYDDAKPLAIAYMESANADNVFQRITGLKTVADGALVFAGLFPLNSRRKNVTVHYFTEIGTSAYSDLSVTKHGALFYKMTVNFVDVRNCLNTLQDHMYSHKDLRELIQAGYNKSLGENIVVGPW